MRIRSAFLVLLLTVLFVQSASGRAIRRDQGDCDGKPVCWSADSPIEFFDASGSYDAGPTIGTISSGGSLVKTEAGVTSTFNAFDLGSFLTSLSIDPADPVSFDVAVQIEHGVYKNLDGSFGGGPKMTSITWYFRFLADDSRFDPDQDGSYSQAVRDRFSSNGANFGDGLYGPAVQLWFGTNDANTSNPGAQIQLLGLEDTRFSSTSSDPGGLIWNGANKPAFSFTYALAPVPEPSTYAMLTCGLATLLWAARRSKARLASAV